MFSSHEKLNRKTPAGGINRREFIGHLVEEYHTTTNIEAQEQVTANLANFAYDPINWDYLKDADALPLFIELLKLPNENLQLHGVAGLCNISFDPIALEFIVEQTNCAAIAELFLKTENTAIIINCMALYYQILDQEAAKEFRRIVAPPDVLKKINGLRQNSTLEQVKKLATAFIEDFGTRTEVVEHKEEVTKNVEAPNTI